MACASVARCFTTTAASATPSATGRVRGTAIVDACGTRLLFPRTVLLLCRERAQRRRHQPHLSCTTSVPPSRVRARWPANGGVAAPPRRAELHRFIDALIGARTTRRAPSSRDLTSRPYCAARLALIGSGVAGHHCRIWLPRHRRSIRRLRGSVRGPRWGRGARIARGRRRQRDAHV